MAEAHIRLSSKNITPISIETPTILKSLTPQYMLLPIKQVKIYLSFFPGGLGVA